VSKQTVYKHFGDKRRLFAAVVAAAVDEVAAPVLREVAELPPSGDVGADLRDLARRELTAVMQPRLLALRRMVIAEATRFPDAGRAFHERGSASTIAALAGMLERLDAAGRLRIDDPAAAAEHFNWLVMSAPMNRAMLLGERAGAEEIARYAESGVGAFLAAYGA
jgi:AcrR family transcriptional regulator